MKVILVGGFHLTKTHGAILDCASLHDAEGGILALDYLQRFEGKKVRMSVEEIVQTKEDVKSFE